MSEENNEVVQQAEKEARLLGWVPKEEFRDGDHWVDAETFVKRGKEINPILRKNNETLLKKLDDANREIAEVKKVAKEFETFQKEQAQRKIDAISKELNALKEQKKTAISAGDGETVVAIDEQIDALKDEQREAKKAPDPIKETPPAAGMDPLVVEWMGNNEWFTADTKYTRIADAIGMEINQQFPELRGKKFFEKLDEELAEVLPEKYQKNVTRRSPTESGSSTTRPAKASKQSYENLPSDAKAACDRYVKTIPGYTKEKYLADYVWE